MSDLKKIHVQLKHATETQLIKYIKYVGWWRPDMKESIAEALSSCWCQLAFHPLPHPVVGATPPSVEVQAHLAVDVITIEGQRFLHCVDRVTGWSEVCVISSRDLDTQARAFKLIQIYRHGVPRTIVSDQEYNHGVFFVLCDSLDIKLIPVPDHSHQSNGAIERANRTLRSFYGQLRACYRSGNE